MCNIGNCLECEFGCGDEPGPFIGADPEVQWCPECDRFMNPRSFHPNGLCIDCEQDIHG